MEMRRNASIAPGIATLLFALFHFAAAHAKRGGEYGSNNECVGLRRDSGLALSCRAEDGSWGFCETKAFWVR